MAKETSKKLIVLFFIGLITIGLISYAVSSYIISYEKMKYIYVIRDLLEKNEQLKNCNISVDDIFDTGGG